MARPSVAGDDSREGVASGELEGSRTLPATDVFFVTSHASSFTTTSGIFSILTFVRRGPVCSSTWIVSSHSISQALSSSTSSSISMMNSSSGKPCTRSIVGKGRNFSALKVGASSALLFDDDFECRWVCGHRQVSLLEPTVHQIMQSHGGADEGLTVFFPVVDKELFTRLDRLQHLESHAEDAAGQYLSDRPLAPFDIRFARMLYVSSIKMRDDTLTFISLPTPQPT